MEKFQFVKKAGDIEEYQFTPNRLRVLLSRDISAPVVTVMITYHAGSRHEEEGRRGIAHILEHLMFKGTEKYNKEKGTPISGLLERVGAMMNATTGMDVTNYFSTLPSEYLELALDIEADRMRGSRFRDQDIQPELPVVMSELEKQENSALYALYQQTWEKAYTRHPYHNPIIGWRRDVENMRQQDIKEFYDRYYWPDNATLTVIGDFDQADLFRLIAEKFGKISASPAPFTPAVTPEPEQTEARSVKVEKNDDVEAVLIAHKSPPATHADWIALEILSRILSNGKTSRLYRALVDTGLAAEVSSFISKTYDSGLLITWAILPKGADHALIKEKILSIYDDVSRQAVTAAELEKTKNQIAAQAVYARDGSYARAGEINAALGGGDWTLFAGYEEAVSRVTTEDMLAAAEKYLKTAGMTTGDLYSQPANTEASSFRERAASMELRPEAEAATRTDTGESISALDHHGRDGKPLPNLVLPEAKSGKKTAKVSARARVFEENGIRLLTFQTGARGMISLAGFIEGAGQSYDENPMIPALTAAMLDRGTERLDKMSLASIMENKGAHISFSTDYKRLNMKARFLTKDMPEIITLLAEQLRTPAFSGAELEKLKKQLEVHIRHEMTDTSSLAFNRLTRLLYPRQHPHHDLPFTEQLELLKKTSIEDIRAFHARHYGKNRLVLAAAGDADGEKLWEEVKKHFSGWAEKKIPALEYPMPALGEAASEAEIALAGKNNIDVYLAHGLPLTRTHADYLEVFIANHILGGDFSARLSNVVRDEYGLTYSIYSALAGAERELTGYWMINFICTPKQLRRGLEEARAQIALFADKGVSEKELAGQKSSLTGTYRVGMGTTRGLIQRVLRAEELELGLDYVDEYPELIRGLKLKDVNRAIREYFKPDNLHAVLCGDIPATSE